MIVGPAFFSSGASSNVVLLQHYDGDLLDYSPYSRAVTNNGGLATQSTTTKWGSEALQFNGSGWLSTPSTSPELLLPDAGGWSIDFWLYVPGGISWATDNILAARWGASGNLSFVLGINSMGLLYMLWSNDGTGVFIDPLDTVAFPTNAFHHVAFWRPPSGSQYAAMDGNIIAVIGGALYPSTSQFTIGAVDGGGAPMKAGVIMDELRVVSGSIDYGTSNFTPPSGPYD